MCRGMAVRCREVAGLACRGGVVVVGLVCRGGVTWRRRRGGVGRHAGGFTRRWHGVDTAVGTARVVE